MTPEERFEMIVGKLDVLRREGYSVMARCPTHDDNKASLSVRMGLKLVYMTCFAGCYAGDIMKSIGMSMSDLYYGDNVVNRTAPGEISSAAKASKAEIEMSLKREIFPYVKNYDGWTYNDNRELTDRLLSYCECYDAMRNSIPGSVARIRLECVLIRLDALLNASFWYHDLLMGNHQKAESFILRCDKTALRQFAEVGIVRSAIFPRVIHNIVLDNYLKVCSRGIWVWERGLYSQ